MKKKWAFVVDGKVTEYRDYDLKEIPKHKRQLWTEVVEKRPEFNASHQELKGPEVVVQDNKVVFKYHIIDLPDKRIMKMVQDEADRRVAELFPDAVRLSYGNMLARTKDGEKLSKKEQEEFDKIESVFPAMEDIRNHQRKLEAIKPIPKDYTRDKYWKQ